MSPILGDESSQSAIPHPLRGLPINPPLVALDSEQGRELLSKCKGLETFVALTMHFVTQNNLSYCGVASGVMVLNALPIDRPVSTNYKPYRLYTQEDFFTPAVRSVVDLDRVKMSGVTLASLSDILQKFPVAVKTVHAEDLRIKEFREDVRRIFGRKDAFMIVNYDRQEIWQEGGGHISPIGAYNEDADKVLILDVARYKYGPVWVSMTDLLRAMTTLDPDSSVSRGYIIVSNKS